MEKLRHFMGRSWEHLMGYILYIYIIYIFDYMCMYDYVCISVLVYYIYDICIYVWDKMMLKSVLRVVLDGVYLWVYPGNSGGFTMTYITNKYPTVAIPLAANVFCELQTFKILILPASLHSCAYLRQCQEILWMHALNIFSVNCNLLSLN